MTVAAALATILLGAGWLHLGEAANQVGDSDHNVLVGRDDDNVNNTDIQPTDVPSPPGPNQICVTGNVIDFAAASR